MSDNNEKPIDIVGTLLRGIGTTCKFLMRLPQHLTTSVPYWLTCRTRLDRLFKRVADKFDFNSDMYDARLVEKRMRGEYADSDNFFLNFNLIDEYRSAIYPPEKYPHAHIPVPPNLERGFLFCGKLHNDGMVRTEFMVSQKWNPELLASAYKTTRGRALAYAFNACLVVSLVLAFFFGDFSLAYETTEIWSGEGEASSFSLATLLATLGGNLVSLAIVATPFLMMKKIALWKHDVLACNETILDVMNQVVLEGGNEASKEEVSLASLKAPSASIVSHTFAAQLNEFWRQYKSGEPMIDFLVDDGTARANGSIHGYEAGTQMLTSFSDYFQHTYISGKSGGGKTTTAGLPIFDNAVKALKKSGLPLQGMFADGKGVLHIEAKKLLLQNGISEDQFVTIGVGEGEYGIPIFHGLSVDICKSILKSTRKVGNDDDFFFPTALNHFGRVQHIAKAWHQTPMGAQYEIDTGGCTADSPEWINRMCNNHDLLYKTIDELTDYLDNDDDAREILWTQSLKSAIDGCLDDWKNIIQAPDTLTGVLGSLQLLLGDFLSNGDILEKFGQGRTGPGYINISECLNGKFMFFALSVAEHGAAAKCISVMSRSRLYLDITLRNIEYKKLGMDPKKEPVMVFMDEHHLIVSSGEDGLSDASILNTARSMGMCFTAVTQSQEAYDTVLGKVQTENMVQQLGTHIYLPTKSESTLKRIADTCGTAYRLPTYVQGIFSTEGARELKNEGVMKVPGTVISYITSFTPTGMPATLNALPRKMVAAKKMMMPLAKMPGHYKVRFLFVPGIQYHDLIGSEEYLAAIRASAFKAGDKFDFDNSVGCINTQNPMIAHMNKQERTVDNELHCRAEGIERVPLFTNDDLITTANFRAVITTPQFGVEHWFRTDQLKGIYFDKNS